MSYSGRDDEFARVYIGRPSEEDLKRLNHYLKHAIAGYGNMTPKGEFRFTRDGHSQVWLHINGRALYYVMLSLIRIEKRAETDQEGGEDPEGLEKLAQFLHALGS
jgi:hypothetical protein